MSEIREPASVPIAPSSRAIVIIALAVTAVLAAFILWRAFGWPWIFKKLIALQDWPAAWVMSFVLLCMAVDWRDRGTAGRWVMWLARNPLKLAGLTWCVLAVGTLTVYQDLPLCMDEYAAWFQARVFAGGRLTGQFPPELVDWLIPRHFQNQFLMVNRGTGEVASAYWPGYSLLLTPFTWLGVPWLCNPTIVAASVLVLWKIAADLFEAEEARGWTLLLALASPAFLVNGMSYYSMSAHLLLNLVYALLLLRPTPLRCLLAGVVGSWALVLHNPLPHVLFALPWMAWLALGSRRSLTSLACLLIAYVPLSLVLGLGWSLWLRDMIGPGLAAAKAADAVPGYADPESAMRLAADLWRRFFLPREWIIEMRLLGFAKLWLWAAPALLVLAAIGWNRHRHGPLAIMAASAALTFLGYFFVPFDQGHGWGYRYFHSAWGALPLLGAAGIVASNFSGPAEAARVRHKIWLGASLSIALLLPLRVYQVGDFIAEHLAQMPPASTAAAQVVMLHGRGYYAFDLVQNDPWLRDKRTVMVSDGERGAELGVLERYLPGCARVTENEFGWVCER